MSDIKNQLLQLNKMSKKSVSAYHKFALSIDISDSSLGVLYALFEAETPCSQFDLCNEWSIPKQTINSAVSSLQKKGLVGLSPIPGTRNKKIIALTEAGKKFAENNLTKLNETELEAFSELTNEERELFIRLNRKYNDSLTEKLNRILSEGDIRDADA